MLPKKLRNFNFFVDGFPMAGKAEEITLPSLERAIESYRGAGMLGPVDLDLGLDGLKIEFTLAEFDPDLLKLWGIEDAGGVNLRFLGAAQADQASTAVDAIEISVRGRFKKIEQGTAKAKDLAKMKVEMPLVYYRYSLNGTVLIEIDLVAGKEVVGGVDRSAAMLTAIGMTGNMA